MKKFFFLALVLTSMWLSANASSPVDYDKPKRLEALYREKINGLRAQTLDKVTDVKSLAGKQICVRPDYREGYKFRTLQLLNMKSNIWSNEQNYKYFDLSTDDVLTVLKAKKNELTAQKGEDQMKIHSRYFADFMLKEVRDELVSTIEESEKKIEEAILEVQREKEERAAREKAAAEEAQRQTQLKTYRAEVAEFLAVEDGPINTRQERVYDAKTPYWKWAIDHNASGLETYRDEKFVLSPRRFPSEYASKKKSLGRNPESEAYKHFIKLETMQADTFGLYDWRTLINLRTGDTFGTRNSDDARMSMWESVRHLAYRKELPPCVYDGTMSMQYFIRQTDASDTDRALEALVGERVFMLDSMKYDVVTDFEENPHTGESVVLHLKKRGWCAGWWRNCISVRWFENLKAMVGKKLIEGSNFSYKLENDRIWKEDIPNKRTSTIDAVEVKDHELQVTITDSWGTKVKNALECCNVAGYSVNFTQEKEKRQRGEKYMSLYDEYISYDAALKTMPAKTAEARKKEAAERASWETAAKRGEALREHKLIGVSLGNFLREYRGATLVNTTTSKGVTVKVYRYLDYKLVFKNGWCVSQTTY
ncbi:MAG: hypothetical protein ILA39_06210 [Bacteroidaceae bacterium]|nr:hypothetical protein [Bacteroidaceae bacterium]